MPIDPQRLKELFLAAADLPPDERAALLDRACGADPELRQRALALLRAHDDSAGMLARPAPGVTTDAAPAESEAVGTAVGPYTLLQKLGEGGMGTVWVAEQHQPVKRRVALKLIKPGMDSAQVVRRFAAERQALALMDHTNIAKVLDAGTTAAGRPYFVMELVHGVPITKYCDELHLSVRERLELFLPVCQAVQHAHQKGVIHRDLKPSNVLVCMQDGRPVPKVIDFGVAKALHQKLAEGTVVTEFGAVIGTLEYMAPEQAEVSPLGADTRSDIYSLGVLLYELLTGTTPLSRKKLREAAFAEVLHLIKEVEPPRPSTRLSESKESLASVAALRRSEPAKLTKAVRGELDWIVMKCLEKDRTRRYDAASGLARDLERYLHDEAVEACPPSAGYRLKKLLRRNKGPVVAAGAVFLALVGGVALSSWQAVRATQAEAEPQRQRDEAETARHAEAAQRRAAETERDAKEKARAEAAANEKKAKAAAKAEAEQRAAAEVEQQRAQAVRDFLQHDLLKQADAREQADRLRLLGGAGFQVHENPTIKELLDRAAAGLTAEKIEQKFPRQPLVQAEILVTVGRAYGGVGEYAKAIVHLQRAAGLREMHLGPDHPDTLRTLAGLAGAYRDAGKTAEAITLLEKVRDAFVSNFGPNHRETLATLNLLADAYRAAGKMTEAIALLEKVRDAFIANHGLDDPGTLATFYGLAASYYSERRTAEAIALFEKVRDAFITRFGPDHPVTLAHLNGLALAYREGGQTARAIALFEKVHAACITSRGPEHPETLLTLNNLAGAYLRAGKTAKAVGLYEKARDGLISKLGPEHPTTLVVLSRLAIAYRGAGRMAEAIALLEKVRDAQIVKLGPEHLQTLMTVHGLGVAYWRAQKLDQSVPLFENLLQKEIKVHGANHPATLQDAINLAVNYRDAKRLADAAKVIDEWLPRVRANLGIAHPTTQHGIRTALSIYDATGQFDKAAKLRAEFLPLVRKQLPPDDPGLAGLLAQFGMNLLKAGKPADAEPVLRECLAIRGKKQPDDWLTFNTKSMLGGALLGQEKYAEAEPLLKEGHNGMKERADKIPPPAKVRLTEALERLVQLYEATDRADEAARWRKELDGARSAQKGTDK
jgi:serine/threonine protein kinase